MNPNIQSDFIHDARTMADFYSGRAAILEGDNHQDDGFKFLAEIFGIALSDDRLGVAELDFIAVGHAAGLFDSDEGLGSKGLRVLALVDLLERVGKADIDAEAIKSIFAGQERSAEVAEASPSLEETDAKSGIRQALLQYRNGASPTDRQVDKLAEIVDILAFAPEGDLQDVVDHFGPRHKRTPRPTAEAEQESAHQSDEDCSEDLAKMEEQLLKAARHLDKVSEFTGDPVSDGTIAETYSGILLSFQRERSDR